MQKIFLNDKQIILCSTDNTMAILDNCKDFLVLPGSNSAEFDKAIQYILETECKGIIIESQEFDKLQQLLYLYFLPVEAGGGVVHNEVGEVLMIFRKGKWDLPKGKRDDGEDMQACAVREVREETGLQQLELGKRIGTTYHAYSQKKQRMLKCSTWYIMQGTINDTVQPQLEEDILEVRWVNPLDLSPLLSNTYPAIIEVLKMAEVISSDVGVLKA